jgi:hypothetical protein
MAERMSSVYLHAIRLLVAFDTTLKMSGAGGIRVFMRQHLVV